MMNPLDLEVSYQEYMEDLHRYLPDGIFEVDLPLLQELGLLNCHEIAYEEDKEEGVLSHSFYVVESAEKLTLFNQQFVVWIVPKLVDQTPTTYTLVALNEDDKPRLEMVFTTKGIYNHSGLVLRILEKFLEQIEDTEKEISKIKEK